jgi:ribosomal protein S18 acetylase RimI-like enzyme
VDPEKSRVGYRAGNMERVKYSLRAAVEKDGDFIFRLRAATLKEVVEQIWGWDDAYQEVRFFEKFDPAQWQVIVVDGRDVGALQVWREEGEVVLANIQIAPGFQNRGLGSAVIRDTLAGARSDGLPVTLWVLRVNPARRLYERLGFAVVEETPLRYKMRALGES